ncbi:hypothetical protein ACVWU4_000943 [Campylobacter coli]
MIPQDLQQAYMALIKAMQNLNMAKSQNPSTVPLFEQQVQKMQLAYNQLLQNYGIAPGTDIGPMLQQQQQMMSMNNMGMMQNNMLGMNNQLGGNMNPNMLFNNMQQQQTQQMSNSMANTSMVGNRYADGSNNSTSTNSLFDTGSNTTQVVDNKPVTKSVRPVVSESKLLNILCQTTNVEVNNKTTDIIVFNKIFNNEELVNLLNDLLEPQADFIGILKKIYKLNTTVYKTLDMYFNKRLISILKYCYGLDLGLGSFTNDYHELLAYVETNKDSYYDLSIEIKNIIPEFLATLNITVVENEDDTIDIIVSADSIEINCDHVEDEVKDEFIKWANSNSHTVWNVDNMLAKSVIISKLDNLFNNTGLRSKTYHKPYNKIIKIKVPIGNDILNAEIFISSKLDYITNLTITKEIFKIY